MSAITTQVLDTAAGAPAAGVAVVLEQRTVPGAWTRIGSGTTGADGRVGAGALAADDTAIAAGRYRLVFATGAWFRTRGITAFFPEVTVEFTVADPAAHYHVPLLLSPFGYSTCRGS